LAELRTLVVGDVHGCADELSQLVSEARATRLVLVGDLFTKGPDPLATWHLIQRHDARAVLGNHDERLLAWRRGERPNDRHAAKVCAALDVAPGWAEWLEARPLWLRVGRYVVTHAGLHPSGDLDRTDREMHLYRRTWPRPDGTAPYWWELYDGPPVIFGHDARRGLVRRDRAGRPWIVGLDTGCVYGGLLSGWLVERELLVQVRAARTYKSV
jgi:hypothetical protein